MPAREGMVEKSAVAEYAWENHYPVHWEQTTVLDHGGGQELLVKEALHIQITSSEECFNREIENWKSVVAGML